jgi:hypothetical protein
MQSGTGEVSTALSTFSIPVGRQDHDPGHLPMRRLLQREHHDASDVRRELR